MNERPKTLTPLDKPFVVDMNMAPHESLPEIYVRHMDGGRSMGVFRAILPTSIDGKRENVTLYRGNNESEETFFERISRVKQQTNWSNKP